MIVTKTMPKTSKQLLKLNARSRSRCMATFDLEAILQLPCGQVSQVILQAQIGCIRFHSVREPTRTRQMVAKEVMKLARVC